MESNVAVATLSKVPVLDCDAPVTVAVKVNEVAEPASRVPIFLQMSPAGTLPQSVAVLATKLKSAPRSSRMTRLVALDWPLFVAVIVYSIVSPVSTTFVSPPDSAETCLVN